MKTFFRHGITLAGWLLICLLMISLHRSGLLDRPDVLIILYGGLAIYQFFVLVPLAFGSRQRLAENAETIGVSNPFVARIFCVIAMVAVFVGFIAIMVLNPEVNVVVRLGVVLCVVAGGMLALRRFRREARKPATPTTRTRP